MFRGRGGIESMGRCALYAGWRSSKRQLCRNRTDVGQGLMRRRGPVCSVCVPSVAVVPELKSRAPVQLTLVVVPLDAMPPAAHHAAPAVGVGGVGVGSGAVPVSDGVAVSPESVSPSSVPPSSSAAVPPSSLPSSSVPPSASAVPPSASVVGLVGSLSESPHPMAMLHTINVSDSTRTEPPPRECT